MYSFYVTYVLRMLLLHYISERNVPFISRLFDSYTVVSFDLVDKGLHKTWDYIHIADEIIEYYHSLKVDVHRVDSTYPPVHLKA